MSTGINNILIAVFVFLVKAERRQKAIMVEAALCRQPLFFQPSLQKDSLLKKSAQNPISQFKLKRYNKRQDQTGCESL